MRKGQCAHSTFLSLEVSSNSLASLAAEFPEDKGSDYKADKDRRDSREKRNRDFKKWIMAGSQGSVTPDSNILA
jgi:hypothetical protein